MSKWANIEHMPEEQQEAWIAERATFLRQVDDSRIVMESIDIAVEELQNLSVEERTPAPDELAYREDFE
tara:strand:- start:131 stop:337 length:207 start_codon:yes stop_codon:yes gene_type:complete